MGEQGERVRCTRDRPAVAKIYVGWAPELAGFRLLLLLYMRNMAMATSVLVVPIVLYILFVDDADGAVCRSDPISSTISHLFLNIKHITQSVRATCVPLYMFVCCSSDCRAYDRYYHLYHATTRAKYKHKRTHSTSNAASKAAKKRGNTQSRRASYWIEPDVKPPTTRTIYTQYLPNKLLLLLL